MLEIEIESIAKKAVQMEPQSIQTLIFAADVLLARDQMERRELAVRQEMDQQEKQFQEA